MLYIYGYGGFAREVASFLPRKLKAEYSFIVDDEYYYDSLSSEVVPYSDFVLSFDRYDELVIAIGDPKTRRSLFHKVIVENDFTGNMNVNLFLKKSVQGGGNTYGGNNIFCPGSIITTNVLIENHNHFNLNTTIGHDCNIGSYNTFSPGVNISGNVTIGDNCYFGTNSSVREGVSICSGVTIGMGAVVLNNITEPGTYVGVPCKKIQ